MEELISKQNAIDVLTMLSEKMTDSGQKVMMQAVGVIQSLLFVQSEIIRCKDCKHWREGDPYSYCQKLFNMGVLGVYDHMTAEDDYCSRAERRTNE